jgi:hypothetical protein
MFYAIIMVRLSAVAGAAGNEDVKITGLTQPAFLSLRQSRTLLFIVCVFCAQRRKRTRRIGKYLAAAG